MDALVFKFQTIKTFHKLYQWHVSANYNGIYEYVISS